MKKIIWLFLFCVAALQMLAQTCPGPSQRTALINLQRAGVTESTRAGQFPLTDTCGNLRYAQYTEVNLTPIAYTPTSTGNTANLSEFVITPAADVWYIDWQGNAILVYSATMATGDKDFLENDSNLPPDNIQDTMYTKSMTTFGGRVYMPGQDVLIIDSVANADFIVNGFRNAQVSVYDNLSAAYAQLSQIGNESKIVLGENSALFKLQSATGTNPVVPAAPFKTLLQYLEADTSWYLPTYPPLRDDAISPSNFLGTDVGGRVVSLPITSIPGAVQAYVYNDAPGTDPGITPDPVAGPFLAYNESSLEEWFYDMPSGFWVLTSDPSGYFITSSEFTGTAEPGDPLTLAQQGATVGQALVWDGTQYSPGTVGGGGGPDSTFAKTNGSYLNKRIGDNVYKYGTFGVGTNDTTGRLNSYILPSLKNHNAVFNYGNAAAGAYMIKFNPIDQPDNAGIGAFNFTASNIEGANLPYSSRANHVWMMGYNVGPGGGRIVPTDANLHIAFESSFNIGPGSIGIPPGKRVWEWHLQAGDTLSSTAHRVVSAIGAHDGTAGNIGFCSDGLYASRYNSPSNQWFQADRFSGTWNYNDPMVIRFGINGVNNGGIFQRNAANTSDLNLLFADNSDRTVVGGTGVTATYMPHGKLQMAGIGEIYNTSGNVITLGNSAGPSRVDINSFGSEVLRLRSQTGATDTWTTAIGSSYIDYLAPNGTPYLEVYKGTTIPTLYVANNRWGFGQSPGARFSVRQSSDAAGGGLQLTNTAASNDWYFTVDASGNYNMNNTSGAERFTFTQAGDFGFGPTGSARKVLRTTTATPNGNVTGSRGDLTLYENGSTGSVWLKLTGSATNTGWVELTYENLYNSNGTTGAARTVTLTDYIRWNLTTNAGTGIAPMSIRVGGTAPNLQSWVATSSNDSLVTKFDNAKGFITQSNNNIILQNTDANNGITIDETSASVITTGGVVRNASSRLDATSNVTIAPSNSVVVAQPGCTDLALTQIGTTSGLERQGTSHWVTNFSGGTLTITPFAGESINNSSSETIPDGKSAWIMCIGPGDFALMVGQ